MGVVIADMSEPRLPCSMVGVAEGVGIICCCCARLCSRFKCCPMPGWGGASAPPPWLEAILDLLDESADIGSHGEFIMALVETLEPYNETKIIIKVNLRSPYRYLSTKHIV